MEEYITWRYLFSVVTLPLLSCTALKNRASHSFHTPISVSWSLTLTCQYSYPSPLNQAKSGIQCMKAFGICVQQVVFSHHQIMLQNKKQLFHKMSTSTLYYMPKRIQGNKNIPSVTPMHRKYDWVARFLLMKHLRGASLGPGCSYKSELNCKFRIKEIYEQNSEVNGNKNVPPIRHSQLQQEVN